MKTWRLVALSLMLSLKALAQNSPHAPAPQAPPPQTAPKPDDRFKADLLLIVAHPDDESGVSAYLAQLLDQGKKVEAVYLTHGEAGHNNTGSERAASLGLVREMELANRIDERLLQTSF